jgi:hypothetical protein
MIAIMHRMAKANVENLNTANKTHSANFSRLERSTHPEGLAESRIRVLSRILPTSRMQQLE